MVTMMAMLLYPVAQSRFDKNIKKRRAKGEILKQLHSIVLLQEPGLFHGFPQGMKLPVYFYPQMTNKLGANCFFFFWFCSWSGEKTST